MQPRDRSVSYLPGGWTALITGELCLLAQVPLADPVLAACWEACVPQAGADGVLGVLTRAGRQRTPSFVLVAHDAEATRLVVAGSAHAEVFAGRDEPTVFDTGDGREWVDVRLDGRPDVRLVADDPTPFERIPPLPVTTGIVLASFVFTTSIQPAPLAPEQRQREAVGWIPPPLSKEYPIVPAEGWAAEPSLQQSGVFRALPWRASFVDPEDADPAASRSGADVLVDGPQPAPAAAASEPSAYEPSAYEPSAYEPSAYEPSEFDPPAHDPPATPEPMSPAEDPVEVRGPLVQAVQCGNGHLNPPHAEACRVCGAPIPAQVPTAVERPPLGALRFSTGETVVLDRDALLGRAPFAVDQRGVRLVQVHSPNNDISRNHVRITLDGWQVFATDVASTNGTAATLPGQPPVLLRAHDPFALLPGTILALADEVSLRFDPT